ncbi:MAG: type II toxin-antitoxin system RelB/DinJ family antitoxin [Sphaerochaeta associata]|uniref:type II toxin-antitoxin system RelB/DinJ family antitoxin n=1 Tax=Sphaerochaeta associata TaxID=1129264 RepID=UPI002B203A11|nr:type II toxin-antitoxin system RelB/DinJ family antitoxin [Sphaerochaeta associata]MEA5108542.1 type II toxin-antitoxin system RelB/DinJ family antitoxin [Sphaerochaeta associata]
MDNATAPITFHMNAELAANFEKACQKLGLTTSEAFTIFATNVARERRIPFEVAVDPFYSKRNIARLKKSIAQMEAIGGIIHEVDVRDSGVD